MKTILLFCSLLVSGNIFSQLYVGKVNLGQAKEANQFVVTCVTQFYWSFNTLSNSYTTYKVDIGGIASGKGVTDYFTDSSGKEEIKLYSVNAMISYVNKNGWELSQMTTNTLADPADTKRISSYYYLVFKRKS